MTVWDVAVIGGGVAGSTVAASLAQNGLGVILLDKGAFPRHKVCGEFLSPEGVELLTRRGVWSRIMAHAPRQVHSFALSARGRQARRRLPLPGWGVSRWILDRLLWEHAGDSGALLGARTRVVGVSGDIRRGFSLTVAQPGGPSICVQARAVVCATGRQRPPNGEQRQAHRSRRPAFVGLKAQMRGVQLHGCVELHALQQGYCGLVEVNDGRVNLCCWIRSEALRRMGGNPQRVLASALRENVHLRARLQEVKGFDTPWTAIGFTYGTLTSPVEDGIWKVGDSAAVVAPWTGDGMAMGLQSAELAATVLPKVFRKELTWEEATAAYWQAWHRAFLPRLRWGRRLEAILLHPRLGSLACVVMKLLPSLTDAMYTRTRDAHSGPCRSDACIGERSGGADARTQCALHEGPCYADRQRYGG